MYAIVLNHERITYSLLSKSLHNILIQLIQNFYLLIIVNYFLTIILFRPILNYFNKLNIAKLYLIIYSKQTLLLNFIYKFQKQGVKK